MREKGGRFVVVTCAVLLSWAAVAGPSPLSGQGLAPPPPEMEALAWLEGTWAGSGWMELGPGRRSEFEGTEDVASRMGGRVSTLDDKPLPRWRGDLDPVLRDDAGAHGRLSRSGRGGCALPLREGGRRTS